MRYGDGMRLAVVMVLLVACGSPSGDGRPSVEDCEHAEASLKADLGGTLECGKPIPESSRADCDMWAECKSTHIKLGGSLF